MKKAGKIRIISLTVVCLLTLLGGISHAGVSGIVDSLHDMSDNWGSNPFMFDTLDACVFCHTPHGANTSIRSDTYWEGGSFLNSGGGTPILLWNRDISTASTTYTLYTSSSLNATINQVRVYSMLCLSCHDGISAINALYNPPGDMGDVSPVDGRPDALGTGDQIGDAGITLPANLGDRVPTGDTGITDLSNDHPISFDYTTALSTADTGLRVPDNTNGYVNTTSLKLFPRPSDGALVSLECSTCHDVHNEGDKNLGTYPFLVVSNLGSNLCTQCHLK